MYQALLLSKLTSKYHLIAPDYPGFGHSSWPNHKTFSYTFNHLEQVMQDFADQLQLRHYTLFLQDYGGPIGFRLATAHPDRVDAIIIQNAVSHEEGLSKLWTVRKAFWQDRQAHEAALQANFLSLESARQRHVGTSPTPGRIDPDTWVDEYYFLNQHHPSARCLGAYP
jgi:pimeloyl-ACP methyl ester carboxylesterase